MVPNCGETVNKNAQIVCFDWRWLSSDRGDQNAKARGPPPLLFHSI